MEILCANSVARVSFSFNFKAANSFSNSPNLSSFRLYELYDSIDKFTATENKQLLISENLTIGMMCLGKAYEVYNRAKVMAIECNPDRGIMVTVFFVDLGQYSVLPLNDLFAIPEYLIEIQPFQVIAFVFRNLLVNNLLLRLSYALW